jgi:D-glycero-alpha-D-manno-heptose 1-phosphate guanylyltransferase
MHSINIDAIILAGGKGTRLNTILPDVPKPMAPINGKPFLDILLSQLNKYPNIKHVILAVGYKSDVIKDRYANSVTYNFKILFSEETTPLGTGGAMKKALSLTYTDNILVLNGDSYIDADIGKLIDCHTSSDTAITIVLKEIVDTGRYGSVTINSQNKILSFEEKKESSGIGLINAGIYLIRRNLLDIIEEDCEISFEREVLPALTRGNAYGYITSGKFIDIGIPETYRAAQQYLSDK